MNRESGENRLVGLAQAGDRSAFEQLYRENSGRVHALCLRLTGNAAEAEDLTQETFIRAWQKLVTFEGRSKFSSWLHRLAVNVVLNVRRVKGRPVFTGLSADAAPVEPGPAASPLPGRRIDLELAVSALPSRARFVFVLYDVYGYQHEEISEMAGIAVGTSKAQLHRARRLIREALDR